MIPGFPSIDAFLSILNPLLKKLYNPMHLLVNKVYEIMLNESNFLMEKLMSKKFPEFNAKFSELVKKIMDKHKKELENYLVLLLDSETNYLYTQDESYIRSKFGLTDKEKQKFEQAHKQPVAYLAMEMKKRIDSYYKIVVRNLRELIPKQVHHFMKIKFIATL